MVSFIALLQEIVILAHLLTFEPIFNSITSYSVKKCNGKCGQYLLPDCFGKNNNCFRRECKECLNAKRRKPGAPPRKCYPLKENGTKECSRCHRVKIAKDNFYWRKKKGIYTSTCFTCPPMYKNGRKMNKAYQYYMDQRNLVKNCSTCGIDVKNESLEFAHWHRDLKFKDKNGSVKNICKMNYKEVVNELTDVKGRFTCKPCHNKETDEELKILALKPTEMTESYAIQKIQITRNQAFVKQLKLNIGKCMNCPCNKVITNDNVRDFEFDHIPERGKKLNNISELAGRGVGLVKLMDELLKTECVYYNCHKSRTKMRHKDYKFDQLANDFYKNEMQKCIDLTLEQLKPDYRKRKTINDVPVVVAATEKKVIKSEIKKIQSNSESNSSFSSSSSSSDDEDDEKDIKVKNVTPVKKCEKVCKTTGCGTTVSSNRRTHCNTCAIHMSTKCKTRPNLTELKRQYTIDFGYNMCAIGKHYGVSDNAVRKWFNKDIPKRPLGVKHMVAKRKLKETESKDIK